ncbi:hypothetical protein COLO4_01617 [Corchorus olitorius]|uniref:GGDEF domain-containing protein n=1 Tax=Corchorus olitorius TaxID=93759 RepID=A0A1R3L2A6_9ROSI|nr:hypothetical protein COLO4_01617 [Corchorus olitorius]
MQTDILRSRDDLLNQQRAANDTQARLQKLQEELQQLSEVVRIDQLTGVLNRRGMDEAFNAEIARFRRNGESLSVALLDIDNFKMLNDQHGHAAGDTALKHLASVVKRAVRPTDIVTRMGGEEFVVILPNTTLDDAVTTMIRLQRSLTKEYFLGNNQKLLITFSAGVALFQTEDDVNSILLRADQAMYLAKKSVSTPIIHSPAATPSTTSTPVDSVKDALHESERRFSAIVSSIPGLVFQMHMTADGQVVFTYLSEGCEALLGIPAAALLKDAQTLFQAMEEHSASQFRQKMQKSAKHHKRLDWEGRIWIADWQDMKWVNIRATVQDLGQGAVQWDGIMLNISQSKHEKQEIEQARRDLQALTAHINQVKEQERVSIAPN